MSSRSCILLSVLLVFHAIQCNCGSITIQGYKMFDAAGNYFPVRGMDYFPRPNSGPLNENSYDWFTDDHIDVWKDHIAEFKALNVNAIRLYAVDPSKSHDKFMCALEAAGIYAIVDLAASCENCAITNETAPNCYPQQLKTRGEFIISTFAKYENVLGFSAGNEVNLVVSDWTINAGCQKKFMRDMRSYIQSCSSSMRSIPVGLAVADMNRVDNAQYYNCRTNASDTLENAEWFGLNAYLFCDGTYTDREKPHPGFTGLLRDIQTAQPSIPMLLTEYGCLDASFPTSGEYSSQRTWIQTAWLHSTLFREIFNGGFVFEFSTERANSQSTSDFPFKSFGPQNYGTGYFSPSDCDHDKIKCSFVRQPNFNSVSSEFSQVSIAQEPSKSAFAPSTSRSKPPSCPANAPSLSSYSWNAVEQVKSLRCPINAKSFQCSATTNIKSMSETTQSNLKTNGCSIAFFSRALFLTFTVMAFMIR